MEDDKLDKPWNIKFKKWHTFHLMVPRCRVCAAVLFDTARHSERLCRRHSRDVTTVEAELGRICVALQDGLEAAGREREHPWVPYPTGANPEQRWWWERMWIHDSQCRAAFWWLWDFVYTLILDNPRLPVVRVREMEFQPSRYYVVMHCAYVITLSDGVVYVFDPTGVQFGPQWPLLARWEDYEHRISPSWWYKDFPVGNYFESREVDDTDRGYRNRQISWGPL